MAEHTLTHAEYVSRLETTLKKLVDAAIGADMYERGFTYQYDNNRYTTYGDYDEVHRGNPSANKFSWPDKPYAQVDYEADVFNLWPSNIDAIFDVWKNIPSPHDFQSNIDSLTPLQKTNNLHPQITLPKDFKGGFPSKLPDWSFAADLKTINDATTSAGPHANWISSFHYNYVIYLPTVLANQEAMIGFLISGLQAEAEIWNRTQNAVLEIASKAITWFDSVRGVGEPSALSTVASVAGAVNDAFSSAKNAVSLNPFDVLDGIKGVVSAGKDLKGAIEHSAPTAPGGLYVPSTQVRASCAQVTEALGQAFEYGLCREIVDEETLIQQVCNDAASAFTDSPATFEMNDQHLLNVAHADKVVPSDINLNRVDINHLIGALKSVGQAVGQVGGKVDTSGGPWLRPAGIGLGPEGPYPSYLAFENALRNAMWETRQNLITTSGIVHTAAEYMYAADGHNKTTLAQANKDLHNYETRRDRVPDTAPQDAPEPYTVPDGTVYKDPHDCAPPDPNGIFNTGPSVGPAPVGPVRPLPGS